MNVKNDNSHRPPVQGRRPDPPRQPAPSVTAPSGRALPFAVASITQRPKPRRTTRPGLADELKTLAPQAALRGEHTRALDLYRTLAALEPTVPLHRIRAGDCLVKRGRKREAFAEYRAAAEAYVALGMYVHARSAWRLVLGIAPGDADASAHLKALDAGARGRQPGTPPPVPPRPAAIPAPPPPPNAPSIRRNAARRSVTPTAPEVEVREQGHVEDRASLALEFADLDGDEDRIWIDLEGICEPATHSSGAAPVRARENSEPVAYFAETSDSGPVRPESVLEAGPRASLVEEVTKPLTPNP